MQNYENKTCIIYYTVKETFWQRWATQLKGEKRT